MHKILNESNWFNYRLADIIRGLLLKEKWADYLAEIEKNLPNSIVVKYLKRTKNLEFEERCNNYEILEKIIIEKSKHADLPAETDIVFHIRLGDVVVDFKNGDAVFKVSWGLKLKELNYILRQIRRKKIGNKLILVYGSHKTKINHEANEKYLTGIKSLLKKEHFEFGEKNSTNPDDDFIYMCNSTKFIKSGGGFSRLIGQIVERNGGIVFEKEAPFAIRCRFFLSGILSAVDKIVSGFLKLFPRVSEFWNLLKSKAVQIFFEKKS